MAESETHAEGDTSSPKDGVSASLDLQELITQFLADEDQSSLELPAGLSAERRKEAKRVADLHPELKCESYGLGKERRLHIFKKQEKVRVKNTFIDDWASGKGEEPAFRSMPPSMQPPSMPLGLLERTLQRCMDSNADVVREGSEASGTASPRSVTTAGGPDVSRNLDVSPSVGGDLPQMPEGFKVPSTIRNTFIHIESIPAVERVVQSMPHGMFRQCLEAEMKAQEVAAAASASTALVIGEVPAADAPLRFVSAPPAIPPPPITAAPVPAPPAFLGTMPPVLGGTGFSHALPSRAVASPVASEWPLPPCTEATVQPVLPAGERSPLPGTEAIASAVASTMAPAGERRLEPGTEVIIQGLMKMPDFNGLTGEVKSMDGESGRYNVLLDGPVGQCGWQWVKVKAENCRLKVPPPPRNAPTLAMDCIPGADSAPLEAGKMEYTTSVPPTPKWEEDFKLKASQNNAGYPANG